MTAPPTAPTRWTALRPVAVLAIAVLVSRSPQSFARDGDAVGLSLAARALVGAPRDVVLDAATAYVAVDTGLAVVDVSNASAPSLLAHVGLPSPAQRVARVGALVLVADGESGLQVIDVTDPAAPVVIGSLQAGFAAGVAVASGLAVVIEARHDDAGVSGLRTVDLADPKTPLTIGFLTLAGTPLDAAVSGSVAMVGLDRGEGGSPAGLAIVDISEPVQPQLISFHSTDFPVNDIALSSGLAYLATGLPLAGALHVVDVADPSRPSLVGTLRLADAATSVALGSAGTACVAARSLGALEIDVSIPAEPHVRDAIRTGREAWAVAAWGSAGFVAERSSAGAAALCTASWSGGGGRARIVGSLGVGEATDVAIGGGLALLLNRDALRIYDESDLTTAPLSEWQPPDADFSSVALAGTTAIVGDGESLRAIDLTDPRSPFERGAACVSGGVVLDTAATGGTLLVANGRGVDVFDVSSPTGPVFVTSWGVEGWSVAVAVDGSVAAAVGGDTLRLLDISSREAPVELGSVRVADQLYAVALRGGIAVAAGLRDSLHVIDVSMPSQPRLLATMGGGPGFGIAFDGRRAFVAAGASGVASFDLHDPASPLLDGYLDTAGEAMALAVDGAVVRVASGGAQHWTLRCEQCVAACETFASVSAPPAPACVGTAIALDGSGSQALGCAQEDLEYQWYENDLPLPGSVAPAYEVPSTHPAGTTRYRLDVRCATASACVSTASVVLRIVPVTFPLVDATSLRVAKSPAGVLLTWVVDGGFGETNVHRASDPAALADEVLTGNTVAAVEPASSHVDAAAGSVVFFKVFGRNSCSGESIP